MKFLITLLLLISLSTAEIDKKQAFLIGFSASAGYYINDAFFELNSNQTNRIAFSIISGLLACTVLSIYDKSFDETLTYSEIGAFSGVMITFSIDKLLE